MTYTPPIHPQTQPAVLVFPGQGSQWPGMAAELLDTSEVFAACLRRCAAAVEAHLDWSVEDVLRQRMGAPSLDRVEVVQPVLFSVHVALAELWLAHGLAAHAVVGQSQGEIAAACVAGALTLEDAARVIVVRSQLFADELVGRGGIASIGLSVAEIGVLLGQYQGRLEIAGVIGPHSVTVAGAIDALKDLVAQLNRRSIAAKIIPASIPSHCSFVEPLRGRLATLLACVRPRTSRIPIYSTVTADAVDGTDVVYRAIQDGAAGDLSKESDRDEIVAAVVACARGESVLPPELVTTLATQVRQHAQSQAPLLSQREREILRMIADGKSVPEMASELFLAQTTIKTHIRRLYENLGVSDRGAAVAQAMRNHILE